MFNCPRLNFAFTRLFPFIGFQIITEPSSLEDLPCLERDNLSIRHLQPDSFLGNSNNNRDFFAPPGFFLMALRFVYRPFLAMRFPVETEPVSPECGCRIKIKTGPVSQKMTERPGEFRE